MMCSLRVESPKPERRKRVGSFTPSFFILLFLFFLQIYTLLSRRGGPLNRPVPISSPGCTAVSPDLYLSQESWLAGAASL
jgi:hypothetical protein